MGLWSDAAAAIQQVIVSKHRLDALSMEVKAISERLYDQNQRLVRIETIIELARNRRLPAD